MNKTEPQNIKYILLGIFIWMVINFFPGSYNVDTWYQYFEMENNSYDDWHSPWLAYLWKILELSTDRFFSMYLLQMCWYFTLFYYLLKNISNRWIITLGVLSSIFFVFIAQYIMKDVHVALAWGSAAVLLLNYKIDTPKYTKYLVPVFLIYGLFLRPNTIIAMLPLLYVYIEYFYAKQWTRLRKTLLTLFFGLLSFMMYYVLTYSVFQTQRAYPEYKLKLMDVIGISKLSGENLLPSPITGYHKYDHQKLLTKYSPATIDHIYWPYDNDTLLPPPTKELDQSLSLAWKNAIIKYPYFYLKNRTEGFLYYLRVWKRLHPQEYTNFTVSVVKNNYIPIDDSHTLFTKAIFLVWDKIKKLHFYDPWMWLLLNTFLLLVFITKYRKQGGNDYKTMMALQLSAVIYTLGMFPVFQIDRDFRYTYWNVIASLLGLVYVFWRLKGKSNPQEIIKNEKETIANAN